MTGSAPANKDYSFDRWSSWSIIAEPFLDTSHDKAWHSAARAELAKRDIKGLNRYLRTIFAATGLWWNVFWWEWAYFDWEHIVWGWTLNLTLIGCIYVGIWYHWIVAVVAFPIVIVFMKAVRLLSGAKKKKLTNPSRPQ